MSAADDAQHLLERALGEDATFRNGQLEAILALVDSGARVLVVERTGWGKSVVYFIATRLLRERGAGPTILISPLLSLMRDQVRMAEALGVRATTMDSTNATRWGEIERALADDEIDLLLVSPERLANERFRTRTLRSIRGGIGLFVVDEAHCISDWGHDFRPDYRRIRSLTELLPAGVPLLATTATANNRVVEDVEEQLGPDLQVIRGPLARESLHLQVIELGDQAHRLAWLAEYLADVDGSGIVYTLTVADAKRVSAWLAEREIDAPAYYGGLPHTERQRLEDRLRNNDVKALVATVALGMGFDKPDLAFVVHFQRPGSAIFYYQQIGRAGRGIDRAEVLLLSGREDDEIANHFIEKAFPPEEVMGAVLTTLEEVEGASLPALEAKVNAKRATIAQALKILEVEGAVVHEGSDWVRTVNPWRLDGERIATVTEARRREQERMREFVATEDCLMLFLTRELDDPADIPCGRCANCTTAFAPTTPPEGELVAEALRFLKRAYRPIEPRKLWPSGLPDRHGRIAEEHLLKEGRALAVYGDAGWGQLVKAGKYREGDFSDELVDAMVEMIETDLQPDPYPTWVTAIPSKRSPDLVPGFARRLASALGLPFHEALREVEDTPPQKTMENSTQQAGNAAKAFEAIPAGVADGPVLLVDDMVDSRWSITVCGVALAEAGSGPVYPVVLGETTPSAE